MDSLALLGAYGDADNSDDEVVVQQEDVEAGQAKRARLEPESGARSAASQAAQSPSASAAALPDASALLEDMPEWRAAAEPAEPKRDPKGTRYNAVPMGELLQKETARASMYAGQKRPSASQPQLFGKAASSGKAGDAEVAKTVPVAERRALQIQNPASPAPRVGKQLLPPQLRKPNVSTEDSGAMGIASRPKAKLAGP
uniref:Uncharacterized protein n=1 Tax=Chrysotila carterae TaxID=13221 RepID=A0A7S4FB68_CHRCT|mmetsp:Transcript_57307/g.124495  ORF Transcript_57307/g.124495 Transcript_57307/m.124495 type:complete len:199 (-) Transcript_57307:360-956(-)